MSPVQLLTEFGRLSSEAIAHIYDACHELKSGHVMDAAIGCLWQRHGVAVSEWPVRHAQNPPMKLIGYCSHGVNHRPERHLDWAYTPIGGHQERRFWLWECSCGRQCSQGSGDSPGKLYINWRQAEPSARVWPTVIRDGIPHYRVCRFSATADDAVHAPTGELNWMCLCGATLDETKDKYLAAY